MLAVSFALAAEPGGAANDDGACYDAGPAGHGTLMPSGAGMTVKSDRRKEAQKMPRSRSWLAALAAIAFLISLAAGPLLGTARAQDKVELRVWDQFTEASVSPTVDAVYAAFTEQNPNITITREAVSSDQMRQTVNTAIASG